MAIYLAGAGNRYAKNWERLSKKKKWMSWVIESVGNGRWEVSGCYGTCKMQKSERWD